MNNAGALFDNGYVSLYQSDARTLPIPDNSVDCVVTSPPYWGLRDYGLSAWEGGDENCDHTISHYNDNMKPNVDRPFRGDRSSCLHCGARRLDSGIGLESTPEEYCANMVAVFREVWRVLKPTGTVWLNLGDSYSSGSRTTTTNDTLRGDTTVNVTRTPVVKGIKPKDLVGIPWRAAFALQADGWYLRSDIIWSKPNPMPESVTDRPTKSHEYIFLLTKQTKYYYDSDAIREPSTELPSGNHFRNANHQDNRAHFGVSIPYEPDGTGRNRRSVWEIATKPYPQAHFATYPEKLVEPCILAGTSEKGVCAECGMPWEQTNTVTSVPDRETRDNRIGVIPGRNRASRMNSKGMAKVTREYTGWQPTCDCNAETVPATVLDPFAGSGTTLAVAQKLGRRAIGTDLNAEYLSLAVKRLSAVSMPMLLTTSCQKQEGAEDAIH